MCGGWVFRAAICDRCVSVCVTILQRIGQPLLFTRRREPEIRRYQVLTEFLLRYIQEKPGTFPLQILRRLQKTRIRVDLNEECFSVVFIQCTHDSSFFSEKKRKTSTLKKDTRYLVFFISIQER